MRASEQICLAGDAATRHDRNNALYICSGLFRFGRSWLRAPPMSLWGNGTILETMAVRMEALSRNTHNGRSYNNRQRRSLVLFIPGLSGYHRADEGWRHVHGSGRREALGRTICKFPSGESVRQRPYGSECGWRNARTTETLTSGDAALSPAGVAPTPADRLQRTTAEPKPIITTGNPRRTASACVSPYPVPHFPSRVMLRVGLAFEAQTP